MSSHMDKYNWYDKTLKKLLLFAGLWPRVNPSKFYRLLPYLHVLAEVWTTCAVLNFCRLHMTNLGLLIKGLGLALSFFITKQKMVCFTFYRNELLDLHTNLDFTFSQDLRDPELRPILLSPLLTYYRPSLSYSIGVCTLFTMYWVKPMIIMAIQLAHGANTIKLLLPFPTIYPWFNRPTNKWFYSVVYIFEIYAGMFVASIAASVDSLFGFYIFKISGQLRTLSYRLENLRANDDHRKVIKECVSRHQILTRCQVHLERIYGPIVLSISVINAMVMCAFIWQATHMDPKKAMIVGIFIVMKAIQTLFYGWFGSSLTIENEKFRDAIYATGWPGTGKISFMSSILTMISCNNSIVLKACSVATISVDMFVAVSNTAVSYYFMLRTLEQSKGLK
ncbi:odorant receptor 13a-like isoform X2 [Venturia canescens]|uniref:odorant receptor 13a-like isoform X2 n=1 Tax=Venturia canescens TaxID=32260 RepID=UPI001C9D1BF4|nr:odorant receptor 13a-like isoform X2 [Venturia canescens]